MCTGKYIMSACAHIFYISACMVSITLTRGTNQNPCTLGVDTPVMCVS